MKGSRAIVGGHKGVGRLYVAADAVSDAIRSSKEPTKNHAKNGGILAPPVKNREARRPLWLIAKHENGRTTLFTIHPGTEGETLPIFSHEEEAEIFLWLGAPGASWRARETTAGELASLLYGPCVGVGKVALDPLPLFGDGAMAGLVSLPREDFVRNLADGREPRVPGRGSFEPETPVGFGLSENFGRRRV